MNRRRFLNDGNVSVGDRFSVALLSFRVQATLLVGRDLTPSPQVNDGGSGMWIRVAGAIGKQSLPARARKRVPQIQIVTSGGSVSSTLPERIKREQPGVHLWWARRESNPQPPA